MNKKDLIFIAIALGVIGLFIFLSVIGKKPKPLSVQNHSAYSSEWKRDTCLGCHAPGNVAPMPEKHPQKGRWDDRKNTECNLCHKPPAVTTAFFFPNHRKESFVWLNLLQK